MGLGDLLEISDNEDAVGLAPIGSGEGGEDEGQGPGRALPKKIKGQNNEIQSVSKCMQVCQSAFMNFFTVAFGGGQKKPKSLPFPDIEGQESTSDFVAKYKRACIGRKTAHKDLQDKFDQEQPSTGKTLLLTKQTFCTKFCNVGIYLFLFKVLNSF